MSAAPGRSDEEVKKVGVTWTRIVSLARRVAFASSVPFRFDSFLLLRLVSSRVSFDSETTREVDRWLGGCPFSFGRAKARCRRGRSVLCSAKSAAEQKARMPRLAPLAYLWA